MEYSIYTQCGLVFKRLFGIEDVSLLRKELKKKVGKLIYHQSYHADDIINIMIGMGMKRGSVVCIHASMKEFYNYKGTTKELIDGIIDVLTPEGTLMMPAFPAQTHVHDKDYIFDPIHDKTKAGALAEAFRLYPGVVRSINAQHSVCAWGKYAQWLTEDHQSCRNCWDESSPWYRMTRLDALNFTLGLSSHYIGTFDHCVEAILYKEHPYWAQFFNKQWTYHYYDDNRRIRSYCCIEGDLERRTRERRLIRYFNNDEYQKKKISNLLIQRYMTRPCLDKMIALGRKGITMYYVPSTKGFSFNG
jgi:aminoglycoside 3-N-acetyltransferase